MIKIPARSILIRKKSLNKLKKNQQQLADLLIFDSPFGESSDLLIYGPYFDFESMSEIGDRLQKYGLEFWDDYFEFKEDIPDWIDLYVIEK